MGLSYALSAALSGLRSTQSGLQLVSNNIANVNTPGYTKKSQVLDSNIIADRAAGVRVSSIQREIDTYVQRQLRTESSGLGYAQTTSGYLDRLQQTFGTPGSDASLDSLVSKFTNALDALATTPSSQSARADVLNEAQVLAQSLNSMSADVQALRQDADRGLQDSVARANAALQGIQKINQSIASVPSGNTVPPDYLDQRDQLIADLADVMDIRVTENGNNISIFTTGGAALFTEGFASTFSYEGSSTISPEAQYSEDPAERRVGTVLLQGPSGAPRDFLAGSTLRSGTMKAFADLRDNVLVEAQNQLDELASAMAEALGTNPVAGTPSGGGFALDVAGLQAGNKVTMTFTQGSTTKTVTFVRADNLTAPLSNDVTADPNDIVYGIDFSAGADSAAAQMQAALGPNFAIAGTGSSITFNSAAPGVTVTGASARISATGFTSGTGLPFFVDGGAASIPYTGSVDGLGQRVGFAARIEVNSALLNDPALLVNYKTPMVSGDNTRPAFLRDALQSAGTQYRNDTGMGGTTSPFTGSIADFARGIIETQGRNAELASRLSQGQQVVVTSLQDRFAETSAVDVDEEMASLLQLQTAYAANARVISTVKEMMDVLLSM